jgi:hypothetical protein
MSSIDSTGLGPRISACRYSHIIPWKWKQMRFETYQINDDRNSWKLNQKQDEKDATSARRYRSHDWKKNSIGSDLRWLYLWCHWLIISNVIHYLTRINKIYKGHHNVSPLKRHTNCKKKCVKPLKTDILTLVTLLVMSMIDWPQACITSFNAYWQDLHFVHVNPINCHWENCEKMKNPIEIVTFWWRMSRFCSAARR